MIANLDTRGTLSGVRATAARFSPPSKGGDTEGVARRKIRAEKERFGAHPLWRRVSGLTFPQEQFVHGRARKRAIHQVLRWLEKLVCATQCR
jgi:hypothetical protein